MTQRIVFSLLFLLLLAASSAGAATAVDDFFLSIENKEVEIPFSVLRANDDFDPRTPWQVVLDVAPAQGNLTTGPDGFLYEPRSEFVGIDTLTYHLQSGTGSSNTAKVKIHVSPLRAPVAGDWDGDGDLEVGVYKSAADPYFYLCQRLEEEPKCAKYTLFNSQAFVGFQPVAGDWDDDGADEVGLYNPATGTFFLMDVALDQTLPLLTAFNLGDGGVGNLPLAGNWDDDGGGTVGLSLTATGRFGLRNANSTGPYDHMFSVTNGHASRLPFVGDWLEDGSHGVGLYDPLDGRVYLRDDLTEGPAQWVIDIGSTEEDVVPVTGFVNPEIPGGFTFIFFDRLNRLGPLFHLSPVGINVPPVKVVIPTDPDDP